MTKKERPAIYLLLVYAVYFLYYFADMSTSANTMVKQAESRTDVHLYLIVLIGLLVLYLLTTKIWRLDDGFRGSFFAMIVWCVIADLLVGANFWGIATHVGLLVLFYLIYFFGGHYIDSQRRYRMVVMLEFILWGITLWFAVSAYFNFQEYHDGNRDVVLNMAYNMLVFIPFLLQLRNRTLKAISIAISVVYIIVSLKRGAMIAMAVMFVAYYFFGNRQAAENRFRISVKTVRSIVFVVAAVAVVIAVADKQTGGALSSRFSLEALRAGSNRSMLYAAAWQDIKNRGLWQLLIGKGSGSSLRIIGSGVHNEALEFLFSYGIVGLCTYLCFAYKGIKRINQVGQHDQLRRQIFAIGMAYIIVVGMAGSALFSHMLFHIMLAMGMANNPAGTEPEGRLPHE